MRLIDADTLPRHGRRGGLVEWGDIKSAPTVDAIPIEYIKRRCDTLNEFISEWGGDLDHDELVNKHLYEVGALVRLMADWYAERKEVDRA